jgi:hypothetical protein
MPKLEVLESEVAQLKDTVEQILPKVLKIRQERDSLREQNATLLYENAMFRIAVEALVAWNNSQDGLSTDQGLRRLAAALNQAEKVLKGEYDAPPA